MKTLRIAAVSLLLMIHSPLTSAQEAPSLPPPVTVVATVLQLTGQQIGDLVKTIQDRDAAIRPIAESVQKEQAALAVLLDTPGVDPAKIGQTLIDIHTNEKHASEIAQAAATTFASTLTDDQRQRMQFVTQAAQIAPALPAFKALGLL